MHVDVIVDGDEEEWNKFECDLIEVIFHIFLVVSFNGFLDCWIKIPLWILLFASEFSQQQKKGRESSPKRVDTPKSDKEFFCEAEEDQTVKEISNRSYKEIFVYAEDKKLNWQIHLENQRQ